MSRVRHIRLQQGEDLRAIALRELGDPSRWPEIAALNDLRLPHVVASWRAEDRRDHTLIWGDTLLIPWPTPVTATPTPASSFGADLALPGGRLVDVGGDLACLVGTENLVQALSHRIKTLRGELTYHAGYGCHVRLAIGLPTMPFASLMGAAWVFEALREEPRLASVVGVNARVEGDTVTVAARVAPVNENSSVDLNLVIT